MRLVREVERPSANKPSIVLFFGNTPERQCSPERRFKLLVSPSFNIFPLELRMRYMHGSSGGLRLLFGLRSYVVGRPRLIVPISLPL